jgi:hypothetical protein
MLTTWKGNLKEAPREGERDREKQFFKLFHRNCFPSACTKTNLKLNWNEKKQ